MTAPTLGIADAIHAALKKKIKVNPAHVNRASEIGHPCLRYLVYTRLNWKDRALHGTDTELLYRDGNYHEKAVVDLLELAGYEVLEQQRPFEDADLQLTGHIDGKLLIDGDTVPMEIKGLAGHAWQRLIAADDLLAEMHAAREPWIRKYPGQIMSYMGLDEKERGVFLLKNKWSSQVKDRLVSFDKDYYEAIKMRCQAVNFHVDAHTLPGRTDEPHLCDYCDFAHLCVQSVDHGDFPDVDHELGDMLDRRALLRRLRDDQAWLAELSDLEDAIKARVQGRAKILAGNWIVTGKETNVKERVAKAYSYWKPQYKRMDPDVGKSSE